MERHSLPVNATHLIRRHNAKPLMWDRRRAWTVFLDEGALPMPPQRDVCNSATPTQLTFSSLFLQKNAWRGKTTPRRFARLQKSCCSSASPTSASPKSRPMHQRCGIKRLYFARACSLVVPLIATHLQFSEMGEEFCDFQQLLE